MKLPALRPLLLIACLPVVSPAQTAAPAPAQLTESQASNVLSQLQELEQQILQKRGATLASVLTRLQAAVASDQAALSLLVECEKLVNIERKDLDKSEARRLAEMAERRNKAMGANDEGDYSLAVRLGIQYLLLTLEAHEASDEDFIKMVPKLQSYIQTLLAALPKIKGRGQNYLNTALSERNPIIAAFQLQPFISRPGWSSRPLDIGSMYVQTLLPLAAADPKGRETLPELWDGRVQAEIAQRQENMPAPEFALWQQNDLPNLHWARAKHLHSKGPAPVNALADMLRIIRDHPGHADAPAWVKELRELINQSAPSAPSANLPKPGGI